MTVDAHVHLASPDRVRYPRQAPPGVVPTEFVNAAEDMADRMDAAAVTRIIAVQPLAAYGFDNSYQLDSARRSAGRMQTVGNVDTDHGRDQLRRLAAAGARGARIAVRERGRDLAGTNVVRLAREAGERGLPMCLLTTFEHLDRLPDLARACPRTAIVVDHCGAFGLDHVDHQAQWIDSVLDQGHVFFKISPSLLGRRSPARPLVDRLVQHAGCDRVLWGSNYPVDDLGSYPSTVAASFDALAGLRDQERAAVFGGTAARLWPSRGGGST